jgi:ribosomal protein S18 acetylase RimI-like enzyme
MGVEIRLLGPDDDAVLANVADEVFDNPVDPVFTREFLNDPRHHIAVAIDDGQVVGFASGVHYLHPDKPPELWINEVGVAPSHQGRGLATQVIKALLAEGRRRGCVEAWVLTDRSNTAARALYAGLGGEDGADSDPGEGTVGYSFDLRARV